MFAPVTVYDEEEMKNAEIEMHAVMSPTLYKPGGDFVGSSRADGSTTT